MERIILFDGVCNLCNSSVQFILKRDPGGHFKFASLQGETGQRLLKMHRLNPDLNSFVLIEDEKVYVKTNAALRVCKVLSGSWKVLTIFLIIPGLIRDPLYDFIANNRYKWFGKKESCMLPLPEWKNRFLD
ncbi:thiol-disulfide oxidoreductase DCC family protein [Neobacillus soli]|uniref:thiol-disulfide oxidoreductase DCC family protein n=1 Tax=Neobacillus soli TaxID=220688 RepID=UPI000824A763|nr:thiol-disulfide oxidoreductase DCC family protein [Neobacillus soli]